MAEQNELQEGGKLVQSFSVRDSLSVRTAAGSLQPACTHQKVAQSVTGMVPA